MVSKVTGSLTIQVLLDRLPINHLIQLQEWEAVDVFGNHGLCGLPEEGAHEKSPKCLGGNLGDFGGILQRSHSIYRLFRNDNGNWNYYVINDPHEALEYELIQCRVVPKSDNT